MPDRDVSTVRELTGYTSEMNEKPREDEQWP